MNSRSPLPGLRSVRFSQQGLLGLSEWAWRLGLGLRFDVACIPHPFYRAERVFWGLCNPGLTDWILAIFFVIFFSIGPWAYKAPRVYHSLLRIHRNLEIHPAVVTELDSDFNLKL